MKSLSSHTVPASGAALSAAAVLALSQFVTSVAGATEPDVLKDLDIRQAPMAKIEPMPASASSGAGAALSVRTAVDRPDARYSHGDSLTLSVEVTEDAYVWIFDTGTSGTVHQIFPNRFETDNFVRANSPIAVPREGSDYQLMVSRPKGAELITVIASKDSAPLTQTLIDNETQSGPFLALRGNAVSVAKDLSISLKEDHPNWVGHQQVIHIE